MEEGSNPKAIFVMVKCICKVNEKLFLTDRIDQRNVSLSSFTLDPAAVFEDGIKFSGP